MEISLDTAERLTGLSRRSLRRRLATEMPRQERSDAVDRGCIPLAAVRADIPAALQPEDDEVIIRADQGEAEAQNDVALILMDADRYDLAIHWLRLAARQEYPDAMHWLGRCYVSGQGVDKDEQEGMAWIRRAAEHGHVISQAQVRAMDGDPDP
ncbi:tetratricopeptide repeat protein [Ectothiorhodospira shaposhnikovii]|uniref:tetratricopeptide repeat protein n=1 Tax=Ectothiorhodospira shaposhnikovii TaxID=1054 RepID=UPI001EE93759|nr:sel1 repeat family protein [Ectothiorhodospira shaposhnikovii]MCG5513135.1 sel1 repeat family protein [Ectothiorhodospira shaposhnikovii]